MQTKNLMVCNYNVMGTKIIRRIKLIKIKGLSKKPSNKIIKKLVFLLLFIICFTITIQCCKVSTNINSRNNSVADLRLDINKLRETAAVLEVERIANNDSQINRFGSNGELMKPDEVSPDLKIALMDIADINNDGKISNEEMSKLRIMRLKSEAFQKKLGELKFKLESADRNLKNYIIITQGKYEGIILYNGPLKFIDSENKQYFGLDY